MIRDYITRPTTIQALQLNSANSIEILNFTDNQLTYDGNQWKFINDHPSFAIFKNGDYVYKMKTGKYFLMTKKDFENTFIEDRSMF